MFCTHGRPLLFIIFIVLDWWVLCCGGDKYSRLSGTHCSNKYITGYAGNRDYVGAPQSPQKTQHKTLSQEFCASVLQIVRNPHRILARWSVSVFSIINNGTMLPSLFTILEMLPPRDISEPRCSIVIPRAKQVQYHLGCCLVICINKVNMVHLCKL